MAMAPGWYPDPFSGSYQRYWDGSTWTPQTRVAEHARQADDPVTDAPSTGAAGPPAPNVPGAPGVELPPPPPYGQTPYPQGPAGPDEPAGPTWSPYAAPPAGGASPSAAPRGAAVPAAQAGYPLASWWARVGARLLDWLILAVVIVPMYAVVLWPSFKELWDSIPPGSTTIDPDLLERWQREAVPKILLLGLLSVLIQVAYEVPQNVAYGRTLGKRVVGLRVRNLTDDRNPTWGEATARSAVLGGCQLVLGGLLLFLDCLWPLWDRPWRQAWHDKAARTVVVPYP